MHPASLLCCATQHKCAARRPALMSSPPFSAARQPTANSCFRIGDTALQPAWPAGFPFSVIPVIAFTSWIYCIEIFFTLPWKRVCREIFHCIEYIFYHSRFFSNLRLPLKQSLPWIHRIACVFFIIQDFWATCTCPEKHELPGYFSTVLKYFYHSGFFSNLGLPWKTRVALNSLYWMYIFYHSRFLSNLRLPWKTRVVLIFFTVLKYFCHSGFLSNLRLPWKHSLPWIHCIEYIVFIIQDFWATSACPEIFEDRGRPPLPDPPPRTPMLAIIIPTHLSYQCSL